MADRENPASDIRPHSLWITEAGERIRVRATGAGWVDYADAQGTQRLLHHLQFRQRFEPLYDERLCASRFSMSLAVLSELHAFFSPSLRRFFARSVNRPPERCFEPARGSPPLPPDALFIGTYAEGLRSREFLGDLDVTLFQAMGL